MKLYKFHWDCGRMGDVEGLFLADPEVVEKAIGKKVYFGEILGKHSEVHGTLSEDDLQIINVDGEACRALLEECGETISGYNPFHFMEDDE